MKLMHQRHSSVWLDYYLENNPKKKSPAEILKEAEFEGMFTETLKLGQEKNMAGRLFLVKQKQGTPRFAFYVHAGRGNYVLSEVYKGPDRTKFLEGDFQEDSDPVYFRYRVRML